MKSETKIIKRAIGRILCMAGLGRLPSHPAKPIETSRDKCQCRSGVDREHWHNIYELEDGTTFIDWDSIIIDHVCHNCGAKESIHWHSPHYIAARLGYYYCNACWHRLYMAADGYCGLRTDEEKK